MNMSREIEKIEKKKKGTKKGFDKKQNTFIFYNLMKKQKKKYMLIKWISTSELIFENLL